MKGFYEQESECERVFFELKDCFHLWTPEDFPIIFTSELEFGSGMCIVGLCCRLFPDIRFITFEIMSNHFHFVVVGQEERIMAFFEKIKSMIGRFTQSAGRCFEPNKFRLGIRRIETLRDMRNVIVYDNRNGFVVSAEHTPFSYPWGANRYYFNTDAVMCARQNSKPMTLRERRNVSHSRAFDGIGDLMCFEGYVSPLSFCDITTGERLFRNASQYFHLLSRNIESNKQIAKEIGEGVFYIDNELFSAVTRIAREKYKCVSLAEASSTIKLELAKTMRYDYNASTKQIMRFLKLSQGVLNSIGIK